ncbi:actin-binding Rho-activating protein-like [Protopterus annectens]|uniref:actin-binding Rho-activating protein-like n=1 Tax=Protopterus annectens TaxID=7888 RepID=UPI001CF95A49|nr:actin-binding Rho-activating protein-like [Protopterus annectens]
MSSAAEDHKPCGRVVKKPKCATAVGNLTKNWQQWANEHSLRQQAAPTGWVPDSVIETKAKGNCTSSTSQINEKNLCNDLIQIPTRKTKCDQNTNNSATVNLNDNTITAGHQINRLLVPKLLQSWTPPEREAKKMLSSRSSSLDTEDSGIGEEISISDAEEERKKKTSNEDDFKRDSLALLTNKVKDRIRPRVKIASLNDIRKNWQKWADEHIEKQKLNPFSEDFDYDYAMATRLQKGDDGYGRPKEGSMTAERAQRAHKHVYKEMEEMCFIIRQMGVKGKDGKVRIRFGDLFEDYVRISDKVVGIALRARKHGMLDFEGEMLWQGRDDKVIITLLV